MLDILWNEYINDLTNIKIINNNGIHMYRMYLFENKMIPYSMYNYLEFLDNWNKTYEYRTKLKYSDHLGISYQLNNSDFLISFLTKSNHISLNLENNFEKISNYEINYFNFKFLNQPFIFNQFVYSTFFTISNDINNYPRSLIESGENILNIHSKLYFVFDKMINDVNVLIIKYEFDKNYFYKINEQILINNIIDDWNNNNKEKFIQQSINYIVKDELTFDYKKRYLRRILY